MEPTKVLSQPEFIFTITLYKEKGYDSLAKTFSFIENKIPSTIDAIYIKDKGTYFIVYCLTDHHSDYIGLSDRVNVETKMI